MPRSCTVCEHPERVEIDRALAGDASNRSVASFYDVSEAAARRHKPNHLPAKLILAQAAVAVAQADDLLSRVRGQGGGSRRVSDGASRNAGSTGQHLEPLAKLLGESDERPVTNMLVSPEWVSVRTAMMEALSSHPEARVAVAERLKELEAG